MKIAEVIGAVDRRYSNRVDVNTKIQWLRNLDMQIQEEVIDTHEKPEGYEEPEFDTYDMDTKLIVEDIYAELYETFLKMKISLEHVEADRYAMENAAFNDQYITYQAYYNRNHIPLIKGRPRYR